MRQKLKSDPMVTLIAKSLFDRSRETLRLSEIGYDHFPFIASQPDIHHITTHVIGCYLNYALYIKLGCWENDIKIYRKE